jgi:type 1 fimbriae regulatory protein FimB/type 1 fimbriae regulatory protein FimE
MRALRRLQRESALANDGQDTRAIQHYLGHRIYRIDGALYGAVADRFKGFWND